MPQSDEARRIRQRSEAYNQTRRNTYARNKAMSRTGRPKLYADPKQGILASKRKYRDKKRLERIAASTPVISYRCACGLEGKAEVFTPDKSMCIWCEYDNSVSSNTGN